MFDSRKRIAVFFILLNGGILALSVIYVLFFSSNPNAIACTFKETFYLYCPGCGGSRAVRALLGLDFVRAFLYYPPLIFAVMLILYLDARLILSLVKNDTSYAKGFNPRLFIILAVIILVHFIVRNLLLLTFGIDPVGDLISSSPL